MTYRIERGYGGFRVHDAATGNPVATGLTEATATKYAQEINEAEQEWIAENAPERVEGFVPPSPPEPDNPARPQAEHVVGSPEDIQKAETRAAKDAPKSEGGETQRTGTARSAAKE